MTVMQLAQVLWMARLRHAWGSHADIIAKREPWPRHESDPLAHESHLLAIAEAKALLKVATVEPKP